MVKNNDGAKHRSETPREPMVGANRQFPYAEHSGVADWNQ